MLPSGKNQLTLVTKVTNDSETLQIIQRLQMLVCKHSEGRVNTMQQRQGEHGGGGAERKDEAWRRVGGGGFGKQSSRVSREVTMAVSWRRNQNASPKIPRQVGDDTIRRLPSRWGSRQDGSRKNTEQTYTTVYVQV